MAVSVLQRLVIDGGSLRHPWAPSRHRRGWWLALPGVIEERPQVATVHWSAERQQPECALGPEQVLTWHDEEEESSV